MGAFLRNKGVFFGHFWAFFGPFWGGSFGPFGSAKEMTAFGWKKGEKWPFLVFFGLFGVFFWSFFWGLFFAPFFGGRSISTELQSVSSHS